jgi:peptidoglycan endopeptidase LytE
MFISKLIRWITIVTLLVFLAGFTEPVLAGSSPCGGSVTVVSGDTLYKIAVRCGTSVNALKLANELTDVNQIKVGQVLLMPGALIKGSNNIDIYIVNHGDTLSEIARLFNTTLSKIVSINTGIKNPNLIYAGQRVNVPSPNTAPPEDPEDPSEINLKTYIVQKGDTMTKIAYRLGITLSTLVKLNPQVKNINIIYIGQKLNLPDGISYYIVGTGDTLSRIAARFSTTWQELMKLNPEIKNANLIYVGQKIKLQ